MGEAYGAAYGLVYRTMDVKKVLCCSISCRARGRRNMESTRLSDGTIAPDQQIYHINSSHRISANSPRAATRIRAPSDFGQEQRSEQEHQLGHEHQLGKTDNLQRADNRRSEVARYSLQRSQREAHRSPVLLRINRPYYDEDARATERLYRKHLPNGPMERHLDRPGAALWSGIWSCPLECPWDRPVFWLRS